jgi:hypothetical protein
LWYIFFIKNKRLKSLIFLFSLPKYDIIK